MHRIDEVHTLVGAGSSGRGLSAGAGLDVANLLKPPLARGQLQVSALFSSLAARMPGRSHRLLHCCAGFAGPACACKRAAMCFKAQLCNERVRRSCCPSRAQVCIQTATVIGAVSKV